MVAVKMAAEVERGLLLPVPRANDNPPAVARRRNGLIQRGRIAR